jgi:hypothetical protein
VITKVITSGLPHACNHLVIDRAFLPTYLLSLRRRLRKGARARSRLAIALSGFSAAVRRVARTRSQIRGLVGSRGIWVMSGTWGNWVGTVWIAWGLVFIGVAS